MELQPSPCPSSRRILRSVVLIRLSFHLSADSSVLHSSSSEFSFASCFDCCDIGHFLLEILIGDYYIHIDELVDGLGTVSSELTRTVPEY